MFLLFMSLIPTSSAFDDGYQTYQDSLFYQNLPQDLQHLIADDYFDLYRFQGNPIAQIDSIATTATYFPLLNLTEEELTAASFSCQRIHQYLLPDNRYLTVYTANQIQDTGKYEWDIVVFRFQSTDCFRASLYTQDGRELVDQLADSDRVWNLERFDQEIHITIIRSALDGFFDHGRSLMIYIPLDCQLRLTSADRGIETVPEGFSPNRNPKISLIHNQILYN